MVGNLLITSAGASNSSLNFHIKQEVRISYKVHQTLRTRYCTEGQKKSFWELPNITIPFSPEPSAAGTQYKCSLRYDILDWVLWNVGSNPQVQTSCDTVAAFVWVLWHLVVHDAVRIGTLWGFPHAHSLVPRPSRGRREKAWYRLHAHAPTVLQILENPPTYGYCLYTTP